MTFWDHLDELRRVLFRVIGVWFVLAIGYFIAMPYLFDHIILAPCHNDFVFYDLLRYIGQKFDLTDEFFTQEFKVTLVNINLAAPFFIHMSTAFWMSVVTAMPYIFFEVWRFINPALYPNERKGVRKALTIGTGMFFIGVLMGYFMVYPLTLRFLSTYQLSSEVENILSLNSYIDNFMMLILCMGLAFELPLVTWLLSLLGVVNKSFLRKYRRHAVVIIVIAAAIITPTGDPFTLSVVAIPLYLLYEMSILMIKDKKEVPELEEEEEEGSRSKIQFAPLAVFCTFFVAELGDKTQLTAITFGANEGMSAAFVVWIGCSLGLFAADILGMLVGYFLKSKTPDGLLNTLAFVIFSIFGVYTLYQGLKMISVSVFAIPVWPVLIAATVIFAGLCVFLFIRREKKGMRSDKSVRK